MFDTISRKIRDAKTLAALCTLAEQIAREQGASQPASEHFVLAALKLPDAAAARAFEQLGIGADAFRGALARQQSDALAAVGISVSSEASGPSAPLPDKPRLYSADPSGQTLVQRLAVSRTQRAGRDLSSADVLIAAALENHTPAGRAFQALGIAPERLAQAAARAVDSR